MRRCKGYKKGLLVFLEVGLKPDHSVEVQVVCGLIQEKEGGLERIEPLERLRANKRLMRGVGT